MVSKKWGPRAALAIYGLLLLTATLRAWLKFDGEMAAKLFGFGLVFGVVLWRAWRYVGAILFGGRSQSSGLGIERPPADSGKAGPERNVR